MQLILPQAMASILGAVCGFEEISPKATA